MIWISAVSLGLLILGLVLAPAFEVRLNRNVTRPLVVSALFLAISLAFANASSYFLILPGSHDTNAALGIISGIMGALGLFFAVVGCARYASGAGEKPS